MSDTYKRFTELDVWKQARGFKLEVYELVKLFPAEEKFRLTDQIIRSVRSTPTNISEGHGRFTYKDQLSFCVIARGSLSETLNHLIDAYDCKYITKEALEKIQVTYTSVEKLLNGYISFLRNQNNSK